MSKPLHGGMSFLIKWGIFDCLEEFGTELKAAGFDPFLIRNIVHAALVVHPAFEAHQHHVAKGWAVHPDLTLQIMTTARKCVPLPSSKSKQMRVWSFLLKPNRTVTVATAENVTWLNADENESSKRSVTTIHKESFARPASSG